MVDAAQGRWDDAVAGSTAGRDGPGDAEAARALREALEPEAAELGMGQVVERRPARASAEAVRKILRSASGNTTVPMSRPSTTTSCPALTIARSRELTHSRTTGMAAMAETHAVTSVLRSASSTGSPSR